MQAAYLQPLSDTVPTIRASRPSFSFQWPRLKLIASIQARSTARPKRAGRRTGATVKPLRKVNSPNSDQIGIFEGTLAPSMTPRPVHHGGGVKGSGGARTAVRSRPEGRTTRARKRPNARCCRGTKIERAATLLLPNWAAKHRTRRYGMDGQVEIIKRNRVVLNRS